MLRLSFVFVALSLLATAPLARGEELSRPFEVTLGHFFAISLERDIATIALITDWDAPVTVDYDVDTDRLEVELLGARTNTERAKSSLDRFLREMLTPALERTNEKHDTNVTEDRISVVYRNRDQWDAIIRYRDGRYQVPK